MSSPDDATLVARAKAGDRDAFGQLVSRHERAVFAIARSYFASEADAEDAVQEAFVKAFETLGQLESDRCFAAWVARITVNVCLATLRSRTDKVSLTQFASTAQLHPRLGQEQLTPAMLASRGERSDLIKAALGRLVEDQRVVLMLRFGEEMTYEQMAEYLDVPATTVQGRLHRAKEALRKILGASGCA
jgi:RNA polymerase sigma-70 factor (ECF subfamily)